MPQSSVRQGTRCHDPVMRSDDARERLRALLREAGVRLDDPIEDYGVSLDHPTADDVQRTWEVLRRFAEEPVEDAAPREDGGDLLLAQYGIYGSGRDFELDVTRQFSFHDEDGEYSHMSQLSCRFKFAVLEELRTIESANLWSFVLTPHDFFEEALAMPGFRIVREMRLDALCLVLSYSQV